MAYQKMRQNIHYIGADGSPFLPENAAELAALKVMMAEERRRVIAIKVKRLTAELSEKGTLSSRTLTKGHSLFASMGNCFDREDRTKDGAWPTIVQLKEEGDRRADGARRQLPHPATVYGGSWPRNISVDLLGGQSFGIWPVDGLAGGEEGGSHGLDEKDIPSWLWELIDIDA
ncbi:hypothetical protein MY5147_006903 [Beauveria neobassiana]